MQTIHLTGLKFTGCHGCTTEEKFRPQAIVVDVAWEADIVRAVLTDQPADTVDWMPILAIVREVVTGQSRNTAETLAGQIAILVLDQDKRTQKVTVTVTKPEEFVDRIGVAGVTISLTRQEWEKTWIPQGMTAQWVRST